MPELPDGVVTFLFTDVEGSTRLWELAPDTMMEALRQHDDIIEQSAMANRGVPVRPRGEGDSRFVVFPSAVDAVVAAAAIQEQMNDHDWPTPERLQVRVSLHTGVADLQLGDYYGSSVNRAARIRGIAHGGQTLMSAATWELVQDDLPEAVDVHDLGEHRLKDLGRPERVYQLDIDGLDASFPPLASLDAVPNNLPVQLTDFIGRPEVGDVQRLVGETRLLTILAPGGAGKTRAAIQAAAELAGEFADGVYFVDLAPIDHPHDIAQAAAEALGIALATDADLETQLLAHLANEQMLLIFDNFEHVVDGAELVARILKAAPGIKVIVTSRAKLNVTGETVFTLPGLVIEWDTAQEAFEASGVHLFLDAAKRADASFALSADDLDPLASLLHLVGGFPLGILLAASWVDMLPVAGIAAEVERSMDFLEADGGDVPDRHRSMRAAFAYSWSMLDDDERRTFSRLALFRGGFTRQAAEAVAGASLRALSSLAGKSLLVADRDQGRYVVHELLRQFAEGELDSNPAQRDATVHAHAAYYADLAAEAVQEMIQPGDQVVAVRVIVDDLDNLRAALRHAQANGDADRAEPIVFAFAWVYEIRGWLKAGYEIMAETKNVFMTAAGESAVTTCNLAGVYSAKFLADLGQVEAAGPVAEEAVVALRGTSNTVASLAALEALAEISMYQGDIERTLALADESIGIAAAADNEFFIAGMRGYQGGAHLHTGELGLAIGLLRQADETLAGIGDRFMRSWNLYMQGTVALMEERIDDAIELHQHQVELATDIGYLRVVALGLQGLGQAHSMKQEYAAADEAVLGSIELFERLGFINELAFSMVMLGRTRAALGRAEQAVQILSSVINDPVSERDYVFEPVSIGESAAQTLTELEQGSAVGLVAAAAQGRATPLDVMVKEVLAESRT